MSRYAIRITEDNLDLLQVLQGGKRQKVTKKERYLLVTVVPPTTTENHMIRYEDTLWRDDGYLKDEYKDILFIH